MRRRSRNRELVIGQATPVRDEYRDLFPWCQWCGVVALDLHEISRGAGRVQSLGERAALLSLCRECHVVMDWLPVAGQLAIKRLSDPDGYDRVRVNRLRGRADNAITDEEVQRWVARLQMERKRYGRV